MDDQPPPPRNTLPMLSGSPGGGSVAGRLAAIVLIGFLLVQLKAILVPLFLAILLAVVVTPMVAWLVRHRVGHPLAILLAELAATLPALGIILVFVATAGPLAKELPKYQAQITQQVSGAVDSLLTRVAPEQERTEIRRQVSERLVPEALAEGVALVQESVQTLGTMLGYLFLTLLLAGFVLHEGRRLRDRFSQAFGAEHPVLGALEAIGSDVRAYVVAKTVVSAFTAICVWAFLEACQVDFALFWGLIAFPLNFIPTVGAMVASLPPMLLVTVDPEMTALGATGVAVGLVAINGVIGSVIDPRYVGQTVKLSPLVVVLSMLLWGVIWGPVGMILAVPIMVSVKLVFARIPALAPVATLMTG
ncbi:MAG: AI-2E family transporter [Myxococcales bacterium]|nr:AI-2E family transporter [Myxococcales bacterium]MCB9546000.1 AI-2E family transporter [Myxococcales bacterium]